ncbi:MAG TPA: hypothetical protein VE130_05970 [Nitrososphaeraceae archaeon]|nr:hypothetical protein [Nitrososphaeraceae archaeon]
MKEVEFLGRVLRQDDKLVIEIPNNEQSKFEDIIDVQVTVNVKFLDTEGWAEGG